MDRQEIAAQEMNKPVTDGDIMEDMEYIQMGNSTRSRTKARAEKGLKEDVSDAEEITTYKTARTTKVKVVMEIKDQEVKAMEESPEDTEARASGDTEVKAQGGTEEKAREDMEGRGRQAKEERGSSKETAMPVDSMDTRGGIVQQKEKIQEGK